VEHNGNLSRVRAGVGHTRWATHGRPNEVNAHPQVGNGGTVAVVHNGIIENFAELKEELEGRGVAFESETDTEVIAHLLAESMEEGGSLREALAKALRRLRGSFAVAAVDANEPEKIVAARHQSPLILGLGEGENFLASAVQALLKQTRGFLLVENGEIVEVTDSSVRIFTMDGEPVQRESFEVDWDAGAVELGVFEDYMLKEIHEQPAALRATLSGRLHAGGAVDLSEVDLTDLERVAIVGCGTSYHAGLLGKDAIERLARIPVEVAVASEYRYADPIGDEKTLVVAITQSGETTDTLAAVEAARDFGGRVLAVTNTQGSLITREADAVLLTKAGPEICVASTKTFLAQVAALDLLALELARTRDTVPERELLKLGRDLRRAPEKVEETLGLLEGRVEEAAHVFEGARCALFLGRGPSYPVALEGALKLKEISYLPAEGYPAGEMKHGPIALVDENCPVVAVLGEGLVREKTLSNVEETLARGADVLTIAREDDKAARRISRVVLPIPEAPEMLDALVLSVPLQLLAYRVAKNRGLDVDKPRNLAKSVTVE
jgi:glutamine---fructose-6-phosphate transaminase (isomerizing)